MNKPWASALLVVFLCCLFLAGGALAGGISSDNYAVPWDARWGGGGLSSSVNYAVSGTVGQGAIGWTADTGHGVGTGFWYGVFALHRIYLPVVLRATP
jgi:hypothetical protein